MKPKEDLTKSHIPTETTVVLEQNCRRIAV